MKLTDMIKDERMTVGMLRLAGLMSQLDVANRACQWSSIRRSDDPRIELHNDIEETRESLSDDEKNLFLDMLES